MMYICCTPAMHYKCNKRKLTSTNIASAYQNIGDSEWLWSWKSMNCLSSRNTCKVLCMAVLGVSKS